MDEWSRGLVFANQLDKLPGFVSAEPPRRLEGNSDCLRKQSALKILKCLITIDCLNSRIKYFVVTAQVEPIDVFRRNPCFQASIVKAGA